MLAPALWLGALMPCFRSVAKGWRKQSLCRIACVYVSVYILFSCAWLLTALTCAFPPLFLKEGANRRWLPIRFFRQQQKRPSLVPFPPLPSLHTCVNTSASRPLVLFFFLIASLCRCVYRLDLRFYSFLFALLTSLCCCTHRFGIRFVQIGL